jgi:hypothetical protein
MTFGLNATAAERFWVKVDKSDGCHIWTARRDDDGYGKFRPDGANTGDVGAHRVAYVLGGGAIAEGEMVCHTCDNPPCVRFDHLFLGTAADNNADKARKGRARSGNTSATAARGEQSARYTHPETTARGERNGSSRLTEVMIREIRTAVASGESQGSVGRRLGVPQPHVSSIVRRKSWAHIN